MAKFLHIHKFKEVQIFAGWYWSGKSKTFYTAALGLQCKCGKKKAAYYYSFGSRCSMVEVPIGVQQEVIDWLASKPEIRNNVVKLEIVR